MRHLPYQRPELVEIGDAEKLTLGCSPGSAPDSCDCAKCSAIVVVCLQPKQR